MANEIYENSWWGSPTSTGWGNIYYDMLTLLLLQLDLAIE